MSGIGEVKGGSGRVYEAKALTKSEKTSVAKKGWWRGCS